MVQLRSSHAQVATENQGTVGDFKVSIGMTIAFP